MVWLQVHCPPTIVVQGIHYSCCAWCDAGCVPRCLLFSLSTQNINSLLTKIRGKLRWSLQLYSQAVTPWKANLATTRYEINSSLCPVKWISKLLVYFIGFTIPNVISYILKLNWYSGNVSHLISYILTLSFLHVINKVN